jgi:hypothetical protein
MLQTLERLLDKLDAILIRIAGVEFELAVVVTLALVVIVLLVLVIRH